MGKLLGLYLFGSVARGDRDPRSDLDLLAVVADGQGKVEDEEVYRHVPHDLATLEPSISWYGKVRLCKMFENGELFGWHLHREAIPIFEAEAVIKELGIPKPYLDAATDVASFEKVLNAIPRQLELAPENSIYELGLVYVCLRNICMAASATLCGQPDFSRYSPFKLDGFRPSPITREEYDLAMTCRMAGQRGIRPPSIVPKSLVSNVHGKLAPWIAELRDRLEKN